MLPHSYPYRIQIAFDDPRMVANAGLLLPATLAHRLGLPALADSHLNLGDAPGRAIPGDKLMTLVASALVGGDCIDEPTCCAPVGPPGFSAARSRRRPPWASSCAASDGATSASWTG